jgi:hypothetical protein
MITSKPGLELPGEVLRAGKLVCLDADQPDDDLRALPPVAAPEGTRIDARDDLVNHLDAHVDLAELARANGSSVRLCRQLSELLGTAPRQWRTTYPSSSYLEVRIRMTTRRRGRSGMPNLRE